MNKKYNPEMVLGKKFHALTYIPNSMKIVGHDTICQWKCDCGGEIIAKARDVIRGRVQSCKCYCFRKKENNAWWSGIGEMPGTYWNNVQCNARNRNIKLLISQTDAWILFLEQKKKCALTGVELFFATKSSDRTAGNASLDRINPSKPYQSGNVQWVHKDINNMKKGLAEDTFIEWCKKVAKKNS